MIAAYRNGTKLPPTKTLSKKIQELTAAPKSGKTRGKKTAGKISKGKESAGKGAGGKSSSKADAHWTEYERLAMIALTGDIEGRIILDLEPQTAVRVASHYAGSDLPESDALIKETIFELANQVVGNAISALNDQGFHFRVHPPLLLTADQGDKTSEDTEALMTG